MDNTKFPILSAELKAALAKRRAAGVKEETDEMSDDEKERRGVASTNKSAPDDSRTYPLEAQGSSGGPRIADEGVDSLDRDYSDAVLDRIAGAWSSRSGAEQSPVPEAGGGVVFEGDARDVPDSGARFPGGAGGGLARPVHDYVDREDARAVTRVGPNFLLNPGDPGITPASGFVRPEPVRKSRKTGIFKSAIFGGDKGDTADGYLSE